MRSRRRRQQEAEAEVEIPSPPKPVVPEVNESHVIFMKNRAKSAGFASIRAGLTKKEYRELLATSPIIHKPVRLSPVSSPEKPIDVNSYSNKAPSIHRPATPPPANESAKISVEIDSPYKSTPASPEQQEALNRTYSTVESTYSNDYEFDHDNEPNLNKTNNNANNEDEYYELDPNDPDQAYTNEYEEQVPEQTFHDEVIVTSLTDPIYEEIQSDDLIGKRFGWYGTKSRDRDDHGHASGSSGQGGGGGNGGLAPEHGTIDRVASTDEHPAFTSSSTSRAVTPTATASIMKQPRLHIVPSKTPRAMGSSGANNRSGSGKPRPATAGNSMTITATGPTDYISGFDIEDPKYSLSIFENYSGLIYRDPSITSTWKDLNSPNRDELFASHSPLPFHSDKRSLHAGRMMNSYRPWGPERPVDPLNQIISQTIAKAAEEKKQSRAKAKEEAEKRKNRKHVTLPEDDNNSMTSAGRRRMSRMPGLDGTNNRRATSAASLGRSPGSPSSSTSPNRRQTSMSASSVRRPTTSVGGMNTKQRPSTSNPALSSPSASSSPTNNNTSPFLGKFLELSVLSTTIPTESVDFPSQPMTQEELQTESALEKHRSHQQPKPRRGTKQEQPPPPQQQQPSSSFSSSDPPVEASASAEEQQHTPKSAASWEYQQYNLGAILGDSEDDDEDVDLEALLGGTSKPKPMMMMMMTQQPESTSPHPENNNSNKNNNASTTHTRLPRQAHRGDDGQEEEGEQEQDDFYEVSTSYDQQQQHHQGSSSSSMQSNFPVLATAPIHVQSTGGNQSSGLPPIESPIQRAQRKSCPVGIFSTSSNNSVGSQHSMHSQPQANTTFLTNTATSTTSSSNPPHHHHSSPYNNAHSTTSSSSSSMHHNHNNNHNNNHHNHNNSSSTSKRSALIINRITPRVRLHSM